MRLSFSFSQQIQSLTDVEAVRHWQFSRADNGRIGIRVRWLPLDRRSVANREDHMDPVFEVSSVEPAGNV